MEKFTTVTGIVVPLDRANVDTDAIIPKQFLKSIKRSGFGPNLFDEWRYLDHGEPGMDNSQRPVNPDFVLNRPRYQGGNILLARKNFGCGSSREHAPWALEDYGFRVMIAPSFADIFYGNSINNGLLPVALTHAQVRQLMDEVAAEEGAQITVDLTSCKVISPSGAEFSFTLAESARHKLLNGLDAIGLTFSHAAQIERYETQIEGWRR